MYVYIYYTHTQTYPHTYTHRDKNDQMTKKTNFFLCPLPNFLNLKIYLPSTCIYKFPPHFPNEKNYLLHFPKILPKISPSPKILNTKSTASSPLTKLKQPFPRISIFTLYRIFFQSFWFFSYFLGLLGNCTVKDGKPHKMIDKKIIKS